MRLHELAARVYARFTPKDWWNVHTKDKGYHIADEVRFNREMLGLTQTQLAKRLGTKQPNIARIESGRQDVTIGMLNKIAKTMGCVLTFEITPLRFKIREELSRYKTPMKVSFSSYGTSNANYSFNVAK